MSASLWDITALDVDIDVPVCEPGIGKVILSPSSQDLIDGVRISAFTVWPDDRGYFLEIARVGQGLIAEFHPDTSSQR